MKNIGTQTSLEFFTYILKNKQCTTRLTLLIIFMVATPMMNNVIKVELPSSRIDDGMPQSHQQQDLTVYIDKQKKLYLNLIIPKGISIDIFLKYYQMESG